MNHDLPAQPEPSSDSGLLTIQIHLDQAPLFDHEAFKAACERVVQGGWAIRLSFARTDDDGAHIDASFETFHAADLWKEISTFLYADPVFGADLLRASVAIRTGSEGWDDYILLASYDDQEQSAA